jgi:hypothetical protein
MPMLSHRLPTTLVTAVTKAAVVHPQMAELDEVSIAVAFDVKLKAVTKQE